MRVGTRLAATASGRAARVRFAERNLWLVCYRSLAAVVARFRVFEPLLGSCGQIASRRTEMAAVEPLAAKN